MIKIKKSLVTMMTVFTLAFAGTMTAFAAETAETADTTDTAETADSAEMETEEDMEEGSSVVLASGEWTGKKNGAHKAASTQNQTSENLAADSAEEDTDNDLSGTTDHTSADSQTAADTQTSKESHTSETTHTSDVESSNSYTDYSVQTGLVSLGAFRTTAYCPCYACSEGYGRHTSTGTIAKANHTIAVDPRVIPYGSKVMINGTVYTAEDRGGAVKGHHIDIFYDTHAQTRQYGSRNVEVFLLS
jgi:3D (Asp-Asp-Asp) domain-containing protein